MTKRGGDKNHPIIEIFRTGTHRDMHGAEISFSETDLTASAKVYDPQVHEAPIVIGHPKTDAPAYGWVSDLSYADGALAATPAQLEPQFTEMVADGRFKKVSASFYPPNASTNPVPGTYYLKHVGFLGAAAPSVKGLKQVEFADDAEAVTLTVDFADAEMETGWALKRVFRIFRQLREYLIETEGQEKADRIIDGWDLDAGAEEAANVMDEARDDIATTHFSETQETKEATMKTPSNTTAPGTQPAPDQREAEFAEREKQIQDREAAFAEKEIAARVDELVKAGRVLPAEKDGLVSFMASLDNAEAVSFAEGAEKQTPRTFMDKFLEGLPQRVEFSELSAHDGNAVTDETDARAIAQEAVAYQEEMKGKGVEISIDTAVRHVSRKED
ncbi:MAG: hypothetical protein RH946_00725 [Rhodospirillales bacterium]